MALLARSSASKDAELLVLRPDTLLRWHGRLIRYPPQSPKANGYAERWVRTARTEVTDRILIAMQRHLRAVLDEYAMHYNEHRPHRGRTLQRPGADEIAPPVVVDVAAPETRRRRILETPISHSCNASDRHCCSWRAAQIGGAACVSLVQSDHLP